MLDRELYFKSLPYICESLTLKTGLRTNLIHLYQGNKHRYYQEAKTSPYYESYFITNGTLEREINIKQILGVILSSENDELLKLKILKLLEKHYPEFYYPIKKKSLDLFEIIDKKIKLDSAWMTQNSQIWIPYYIIRLFYGFENNQLEVYNYLIQKVEQSFTTTNNWESENGFDNSKLIIPEYLSFIKESEFLCQNIKSCSDIAALITNRGKNIDFLSKSDNRHEIFNDICFITLMFKSQSLTDTTFTGLISLTKNELRRIFTSIIECYEKNGEYKSLSKKKIFQYYIIGIYIQSILKEYKKAKEIFRLNNVETQLLETNRLINEIEYQKKENQILKLSLDEMRAKQSKTKVELEKGFYDEIKTINLENEKLKQTLKEYQENNEELFKLREIFLSIESNYETTDNSGNNSFEIPQNKKIIIVGGQEKWRNKVRERFDYLHTVDGTNPNLNLDFFNNADYVLFFFSHMNHPTYLKIKTFLTSHNIAYGYANQTNLDQFVKQLLKNYSSDLMSWS